MSETLNLSLETSKVEAIAKTYPEEMREPFLWLCGFVCNECGRNVDVLEAKVKELKYETTASTFLKILRGRWNRDAAGNEASPIMNVKSFLQVIKSLRAESQLAAMAGKVPFVKTDTSLDIFRYINVRRAPDRVNKFGFIIGPTGSQKTASFRQYCLENNHGACVWMESGARPRLSHFITDLAKCYGAPRGLSIVKKELIIHEAMNSRRTIIIDNVQRLYRADRGGNQEVFGFLQKLQDETGCTVILSATPDFNEKFTSGIDKGYFEQFVGRCGGRKEFLSLPLYTPHEDILQIAESFELQHADKHVDYLDKICKESGRVRILFGDLQRAKQRADKRKEPLTIAHLRFVRDDEE